MSKNEVINPVVDPESVLSVPANLITKFQKFRSGDISGEEFAEWVKSQGRAVRLEEERMRASGLIKDRGKGLVGRTAAGTIIRPEVREGEPTMINVSKGKDGRDQVGIGKVHIDF